MKRERMSARATSSPNGAPEGFGVRQSSGGFAFGGGSAKESARGLAQSKTLARDTEPGRQSGRTYWRSLDELAETPEFRQWVERELPAGASEWNDPVSRRHFVKIMSASFLLAGFGLAGSGCRRPEQKILPFSKMPENYIHGVAQYFATAMPTRGSAIPLVVKSNDGRPTKIEGNSLHPDSNGGTDRYAQASILNLYDRDRTARFMELAAGTTPPDARDH